MNYCRMLRAAEQLRRCSTHCIKSNRRPAAHWAVVCCFLLACLAPATVQADGRNECGLICLLPVPQARDDLAHRTGKGNTTYTISGFVLDQESGENLIGATVYAPYYRKGTTTNRYGFFSLTVDADSITLAISHVGYLPVVLHRRLANDLRLDVLLQPMAVNLNEIEVIAPAGEPFVDVMQTGTIKLPVAKIRSLPVLAGEVDVLKTLQLLTGVQSGREGSSGLYVRGGSPDQNLVLLDGVTVYNASHLFGFLSVFNGDAIKDVTLIKGGFPARYGGRLSSVVDLSMKEGNLKEFEGTANIGLVASSFTVEGPIKKDQASFLVAARRTYLDLLVYPFLKKRSKVGYYFYDVSAKANSVVSEKDRVYLSFYTGHDRGYSRRRFADGGTGIERHVDQDLGWRNMTATARWNRILGPRIFANVLLGYTRYRLRILSEETLAAANDPAAWYHSSFLSGITNGTARLDFEFAPRFRHYVRFGFGGTAHAYHTGAFSELQSIPDIAPLDTIYGPDQLTRSVEWHAYAEDEMRLFPWLKIDAGAHISGFLVAGRQYYSIQPRIGLWWGLNATTALELSYASMQQYIHLLTTTSGLSLPLDLWVPATDRVRPQKARQVTLGLVRTLQDGKYQVALESYYKKMRDLIAYKEGANYYGAAVGSWQDQVEHGEGRSFGGELFIQKKTGRITGWAGYSLIRTERRFAELNDGRVFPYRYDRLHDVSLVVNWRWNESIELAGTWVYGTGQAIWLPIGHFYGFEHEPGGDNLSSLHSGPRILRVYGARNASRMPAYHRFDIAMHLKRNRQRMERILSFGIYNLYNRKNPFLLEASVVRGEDREEQYLLFKKTSLFPILPFVTYRLEF